MDVMRDLGMSASIGRGVYHMGVEFGDTYRVKETGFEGEVMGVACYKTGERMVCLAPFTDNPEEPAWATWHSMDDVEKVS